MFQSRLHLCANFFFTEKDTGLVGTQVITANENLALTVSPGDIKFE